MIYMRLYVVAVGKLKKRYFRDAAQDYLDRLSHYVPLQMLETEQDNPYALLSRRGKHVVLDPGGKEMASEEFAQYLQQIMNTCPEDLYFYVGGAEGFSKEFLARADFRISLSQMTFPHELARVMFLEQLYRAFTILKGEKYHK